MKVLIFVHCFFPDHFYGTETYTLDIARNLRELGHESIVVSAIFPGEAQKESLISYSEYNDIPVYTIDKNYIPHTRVKDTYYQPDNISVLEQLITDIAPDIIHVTHLINHTASLLEVVNKLGIPVVATFTDFYGFCFNNKLEASDGSLCTGPNIKRSNCLACYLKAKSAEITASHIERYIGKYPISKIFAWVIRNLINIPIIRKNKAFNFAVDIVHRPDVLSNYYSYYNAAISPTNFLTKAYQSNGLQIPIYDIKFGVDLPRIDKSPRPIIDSPIRFGFIGQIAPHKGISVLVEAFSYLDQSKAELLVFGSGDQDFDYFSKLKQMSKGCNIKFCGTFPKEDMSNIFDRLDFLVIPSLWYENSPLVLLNSLASKTPVIASDVEGMTEFINSGGNGFVFKMGNVQELQKILSMIISAPQYYLAMSKNTEYKRTTLSMVNEVVRVYEDVMDSKVIH